MKVLFWGYILCYSFSVSLVQAQAQPGRTVTDPNCFFNDGTNIWDINGNQYHLISPLGSKRTYPAKVLFTDMNNIKVKWTKLKLSTTDTTTVGFPVRNFRKFSKALENFKFDDRTFAPGKESIRSATSFQPLRLKYPTQKSVRCDSSKVSFNPLVKWFSMLS